MTFQNIQTARVMQAVLIAFGLAIVLSLVADIVIYPFLPDEMKSRLITISSSQDYEKAGDVTTDYREEYTILVCAQWLLALVAAVWAGRWAAKQAVSPEQAVGYGLVVGLGLMFSYGVMCIGFSPVHPLLRLGFFLLLPPAGALGGRWAGANLDKFRKAAVPIRPQPYGGYPGYGGQPPAWGAPSAGSGPDVYYNMGVTAAMGARREEARGHFTRVLQMNPYYLPAWLQLANLADTPEQAWNYVQQARAINPNDPAVMQAVNVIWPKVAANAARSQQARSDSLLREIEEAATELEFPAIQPPSLIAPPEGPGETPTDIFGTVPATTPAEPLTEPTLEMPPSEQPTLRDFSSELPTELNQPPVVPDLTDEEKPDDSKHEKKKSSDTFDPWG